MHTATRQTPSTTQHSTVPSAAAPPSSAAPPPCKPLTAPTAQYPQFSIAQQHPHVVRPLPLVRVAARREPARLDRVASVGSGARCALLVLQALLLHVGLRRCACVGRGGGRGCFGGWRGRCGGAGGGSERRRTAPASTPTPPHLVVLPLLQRRLVWPQPAVCGRHSLHQPRGQLVQLDGPAGQVVARGLGRRRSLAPQQLGAAGGAPVGGEGVVPVAVDERAVQAAPVLLQVTAHLRRRGGGGGGEGGVASGVSERGRRRARRRDARATNPRPLHRRPRTAHAANTHVPPFPTRRGACSNMPGSSEPQAHASPSHHFPSYSSFHPFFPFPFLLTCRGSRSNMPDSLNRSRAASPLSPAPVRHRTRITPPWST